MGGCCCSSRKAQFCGTPVYYYCSPILEGHGSLTSNDGAASTLTVGFLIDLNTDRSIPDTYRPPPTPLPYDVVSDHSPLMYPGSIQGTISSPFEALDTGEVLEKSEFKPQSGSLLELSKSSEVNFSAGEEEDDCPICLEEYGGQNPKTITKCDHHFHLPCILEWMERSDICPICDQEMIFDHTFK